MPTPSSLPPNWAVVLDEIQQTLTKAIHLAETRETSLAGPEIAAPTHLVPDIQSTHLDKLEERALRFQAPLVALDEAFKADEEHVRQHLASGADLRRRLADWVGRAVG